MPFRHRSQKYAAKAISICCIPLPFPSLTFLCQATSNTFETLLRTFGFLQKIKKGKQFRELPNPAAKWYKGQALRVFGKRFLALKYSQKLFQKNLDTTPCPLKKGLSFFLFFSVFFFVFF